MVIHQIHPTVATQEVNKYLLYLHTELKLPETLHEGHSLDVSHGAAQFDNAHLWLMIVFHGNLSYPFHPFLDGVRYMRNNWNGGSIKLLFQQVHSNVFSPCTVFPR